MWSISDGSYIAELEITSNENCDGLTNQELNLKTSVGIDEKPLGSFFSVYPNPISNGKFKIKTRNKNPYSVTVFSALSAELIHKEFHDNSSNNFVFEVFSSGIYLVRIQSDNVDVLRKIVVE